MIFLMILLCCVLLISIFFATRSHKKARRKYYLGMTISKEKSSKESAISQFFTFRNLKFQMYASMAIGSIAGGVFAAFRGGSFLITGCLVAFVIWAIFKYQEGNYEINYRKNGKSAVEYLNAVISAGGTLEDWVEEVIPRINGPLANQFRIGFQNYKNNIPITHFLQSLIKNCPDSSLGLIWSGLLREVRQSGDMRKFVEEALTDLQNQERINRVMARIRKSGGQMMAWVCVLPGTLYALFSDTLKEILVEHPFTNIAMLILLVGYGFILW
ncbi:type II secretion system F family protein, partial [Bacillus subtilis]|uniref:type II secretion system F family protein n=1 Tax=Bacillus subtilis TaxID=1423 RepID=UPI003F7C2B37